MSGVEGHAFICYVREDAERADEVERLLREADIPVWRDTESLWPGDDWRQKIREAITEGAFAFIPIFTSTSVAKGVSGQNEELYLAAEEMRRRQPGVPWMIPVRFDDCRLPRLRLAGGDTLDAIQRADLFGEDAERQAQRLIQSVRRIIEAGHQEPRPPPAGMATTIHEAPILESRLEHELKSVLRDPAGDIKLYDLLIPMAEAVHDELADPDRYPVEGAVSARELADQVDRYWIALDGLLDILVLLGSWSLEVHARTISEVVERVDRARGTLRSGNTARLAVRWFPLLATVYAGGLAAVARENFVALRSFAVDPLVRDDNGRVPAVARARTYQPFNELPLAAQVIALRASGEEVDDETINALATRQRGNRYTPASDFLHDRLRSKFRLLLPDDELYSETFDLLEVHLGLLVSDARLQAEPADGEAWRGPWIPDPTSGRFTWRDRYSSPEERIERLVLRDLLLRGEEWPPLRAGLFGGSVARANAAFDRYLEHMDEARRNRW